LTRSAISRVFANSLISKSAVKSRVSKIMD